MLSEYMQQQLTVYTKTNSYVNASVHLSKDDRSTSQFN